MLAPAAGCHCPARLQPGLWQGGRRCMRCTASGAPSLWPRADSRPCPPDLPLGVKYNNVAPRHSKCPLTACPPEVSPTLSFALPP